MMSAASILNEAVARAPSTELPPQTEVFSKIAVSVFSQFEGTVTNDVDIYVLRDLLSVLSASDIYEFEDVKFDEIRTKEDAVNLGINSVKNNECVIIDKRYDHIVMLAKCSKIRDISSVLINTFAKMLTAFSREASDSDFRYLNRHILRFGIVNKINTSNLATLLQVNPIK
jgi:hypothetical protein